jgi:hypothetical protein
MNDETTGSKPVQIARRGVNFLIPAVRAVRVFWRVLRRIFAKDSLPNLILVTALLCVAAAAAVGAAHTVTAPRIEAVRQEALEAALGEVLPGEDLIFTQSSIDRNIYEGRGADGSLAGFSILVSPRGHAGPVRMAVGVNTLREVTGVKVLSHRELGGLDEVRERGVGGALALLDRGLQP